MSANRYSELARTGLQAANVDVAFAELGLREGFYSQACFNCQQVAEKALKAYLFGQHQELVRTQSLPRWLQECQRFDGRFADVAEACAILTSYYTDTRYPDSMDALGSYDAEVGHEALDSARQVLARVTESLAPLLGGEA